MPLTTCTSLVTLNIGNGNVHLIISIIAIQKKACTHCNWPTWGSIDILNEELSPVGCRVPHSCERCSRGRAHGIGRRRGRRAKSWRLYGCTGFLKFQFCELAGQLSPGCRRIIRYIIKAYKLKLSSKLNLIKAYKTKNSSKHGFMSSVGNCRFSSHLRDELQQHRLRKKLTSRRWS